MTIANSPAAAPRRNPGPMQLHDMLVTARERTLLLTEDLGAEQLLGPRLAIVNPPLWEIGHIGWFQEYWCLRQGHGPDAAASYGRNADALYDSAKVPHRMRWDLPLPGIKATLEHLDRTLERVLERLAREGAEGTLGYFAPLALFHEEMHCEALTYSRQTLAWPAPRQPVLRGAGGGDPGSWPGDAELPGGNFQLGATAADGFVFDNEKWAHRAHVLPFRMARAPVTNAEFVAFVEDDGYRREALWRDAGWRWRERERAAHPLYWRREGVAWQRRVYDRWLPLRMHEPVIHVNWYEADAYCRWASRRLPTEAEWEFAATIGRETPGKTRYPWGDTVPEPLHANFYAVSGDVAEVGAFAGGDSAGGCRQMFGNVWEWTGDWFGPYPGYVCDPYREYSEPWFGNHKVLRGGCFATRASLLRGTWRNFYTPERRDVFAGFRTCAP